MYCQNLYKMCKQIFPKGKFYFLILINFHVMSLLSKDFQFPILD